MTWTTERRAILVGLALGIEGLLSVRVGFAPFEQRQALLTLLAGWFVGGCGLLAWLQVSKSRTGILLTVASALWFIGGFRWLDQAGVAAIAGALSSAYTGATAHAILTFPNGRATDRAATVAIAGIYAASLIASPVGPSLIAGGLIASLVIGRRTPFHRRAFGGSASGGRTATGAGLLFAGSLIGGAVLPFAVPGGTPFDFRLVDQLGFMLVAAWLATALLQASERRSRVTDLVVELDPSRGGLARELALAIGDPTLEVGYWLPEQDRFVDATGHTLVVRPPGDPRETTVVERDGVPVAVLIHDSAVSADPAIRAAMTRAAELGTVNARLQAEARAQAATVDASRRRLLRVTDDERRELDLRLREGIEPALDDLQSQIDSAAREGRDSDAILASTLEQLVATRRDLAGIVEDLHPRILDERGLYGAIDALATRCPVPVDIECSGDEPTDTDVRTALFFVCSEGLANVAKHAAASRVTVRLDRRATEVVLEVEDDGQGGAGVERGSGLEGIRDRVQALGGSFALESRIGHGTRLIAMLPVGATS